MSPQHKVKRFKLIALFTAILSQLTDVNSQNLEQLQLIESSMDHTIDPCEDFHGYVCGNWPKRHEHVSYTDIPEFLQYNHTLEMMNLVRSHFPAEQLRGKRNQSFTDKAAIYLHSCVNVRTIELVKYLEEIKPGPGLEWPLLDGSQNLQMRNWSQFDAFALLGQLQSYGYASDVIAQKSVRRDGEMVTIMKIPDAAIFHVASFREILADLKLGKDVVERQLDELQRTHNYWQAAYKDYAEFGVSLNLFSYDDLKQSNPQLSTYLDYIMPQHLRDDNALVAIPYWDYIQFLLSRQMQSYEQQQQFCNYLMVKFLMHLKQANAAGCVTTGQRRMHLAYDYLFYKHFYRSQVRTANKDISGLSRQIHKHLLATVYENHLNMTIYEIQSIKASLRDIAINIGNLPEGINAAFVEKFYSSMPDMDVDNFYANDLRLLKNRVLESVTCPATMSCDKGIDSTPLYLAKDDMLVIPFATLRAPVYQPNVDPLLAISSFGAMLGHELTHSVTPRSDTIYDILVEDNLEDRDVNEAIKCMQRQDPSDIDERIADLVGVRVAYRTYSQEYNVQPNFTRIPWRRLFFMNLGQMFCAKQEGLASYGTRLNSIAMNLDAFSEAFQCPVGSKMNPQQKCRYY